MMMNRRLFILNTLFLAGCSGSSQLRETYDLAPKDEKGIAASRSSKQLTIAEPKTLASLDSERIAAKQQGGGFVYLPDGAYADRLPRLVQSRLIQLFENSNRLGSVGRPGDRISSDYQMVLDIRAFHIDVELGMAQIEISVKLMNDRTGRIMAADVFGGGIATSGSSAAEAAKAFERLLSEVLGKIVQWAVKKV